MDPREKDSTPEQPELEQPDWDDIVANRDDSVDKSAPAQSEEGGRLGQEDDNYYQASDEALPEDEEEAAIERDPSREGARFDES